MIAVEFTHLVKSRCLDLDVEAEVDMASADATLKSVTRTHDGAAEPLSPALRCEIERAAVSVAHETWGAR